MADLFQTTRNNITLHISNIFKENELDEISVGKESLLTAGDGKKYKTKFPGSVTSGWKARHSINISLLVKII